MQLRPMYVRASYLLLLSIATSMLTVATPCQTPTTPPTPVTSFEVASVRMVDSSGMAVFPKFPAPQFVAENFPLAALISIAYRMPDGRILGKPSWFDSTLYTVHAKPEGDAALTEEQFQPLLQDLLRRRFHLVVHRETRQVSGYELVIAKDRPKLEPTIESSAMAFIFNNGIRCPGVNTTTLALLLAHPVGHPVVDKTGLSGFYKLDLHFAPIDGTASDLPDIFTAVQEQLGLKLESKKVLTEFLIIDHVDKTPTEN